MLLILCVYEIKVEPLYNMPIFEYDLKIVLNNQLLQMSNLNAGQGNLEVWFYAVVCLSSLCTCALWL